MRARRVVSAALMVVGMVLGAGAGWGEDKWTQPTAEELSMTSLPQVPGAPAFYLYREEKTIDHLHMYSEYVRMKILTEGGKKYANVELKYIGGGEMRRSIGEVEGRTIHPDGTVIPFTGKPYDQTLIKGSGMSAKAKVFTLPDVTVGSIIEYRYNERWEDNWYSSPEWIIQNDLYLRKGHFIWQPTDRILNSGGKHDKVDDRLAWSPILPAGAKVVLTTRPGNSLTHEGDTTMELNIADVAPAPEEEYMPPLAGFRYRVLFYYTGYLNQEEFWKKEGKDWSGDTNKFIGSGSGVKDAVARLTTPSDAPEVKLKKLYASVMELDNTDFTREHSRTEDKAQGLSQVKTTDDMLANKRGTSDQLALLFISMARAAGMKAYAMQVTDRDRSMFYEAYTSLAQLDDYLAIVDVNGKEVYFDPGSRYCPFGHLAWKHTMTRGLRQMDGGTQIAVTPMENYKFSQVVRVANLTLDEQGVATGKIDVNFSGLKALEWRQKALTGDRESLERDLKESMEEQLPGSVEVKLGSIDKLAEYEEVLGVHYTVKGAIGTGTGKRLLITNDLFEGNSKAPFVHEKRETAVVFEYPSTVRDAVRINFPKNFELESMPAADSVQYPKHAMYSRTTEKTATSVTVRRDLMMADFFYLLPEYAGLRDFYTKFQSEDQEPVILKLATTTASGN